MFIKKFFYIFIILLFVSRFIYSKNVTAKYKQFKEREKYFVINPYFKFNLTLILKNLFLGILIDSGTTKSSYMRQTQKWDGPIVVGVNMLHNNIISHTSYCIYCDLKTIPNISDRLFAFFFYKHKEKDYPIAKKFFKNIDCKNTKFYNAACKKSKLELKNKNVLNYPQNYMKNKIRKVTKSDYILFIEPDQYLSQSFERKIESLLEEHVSSNKKNVIVIRDFEITSKVVPKNKKILNDLIKNNDAYEIDQRSFPVTYQTPKLRQWLETNESYVGSLQYEQPYDNVYWDPLIIIPKDAPYHDENFPYPLDTNTEHQRELCRGGYHFLIANDVFSYHMRNTKYENYAMKAALFSSSIKKRMLKAQKLFNQRLDTQYPETKNTCFT